MAVANTLAYLLIITRQQLRPYKGIQCEIFLLLAQVGGGVLTLRNFLRRWPANIKLKCK
jgi:hypothetical protein